MLGVANPTARSAVRELRGQGLLEECGEKRWPRVYLARPVLDAVLHPLEDLRQRPEGGRARRRVKSGAGRRRRPTRRADRLMAEAMDIIDAAREQGVQLRLTGGLAVRRYCTDLDFMDREYSDIDFVGLASRTRRSTQVFDGLDYTENRYVTQATDAEQLQYIKTEALERHDSAEAEAAAAGRVHHADEPPLVDHVDIFLDVMRMDHDVDVRDRLEIDDYAISPADAFIAKLQIGKINQKDVHDVIALVKDVPLRDVDDDRRSTSPTSPRCARATGACTTTSRPTSTSHSRWSTTTASPRATRQGLCSSRGHQGGGRGRQQEPSAGACAPASASASRGAARSKTPRARS